MNLEHLSTLRSDELNAVKRHIDVLKSENIKVHSILEIGAGTGGQTLEFRKEGYDVTPIDLSISNYSGDRVVDIIEYDGVTLPFSDSTFDLVFSSNVLEHIGHLSTFQNELHRVLKPNGYMIHVVPNGRWRFWTNVSHYFNIPKKAFMKLVKLSSTSFISKNKVDYERAPNEPAKRSPSLETVLNILRPSRHGELGNALTEIVYFSHRYWKTRFNEKLWLLDKTSSNGIFYTGNMLLGPLLSINSRKIISQIFGGVCFVYVLRRLSNNERPE